MMITGSLAFTAAGFWFISDPDKFRRYDPTIINTVGILAIVFFGFIAVLLLRKLRENTPALIIDENGVFDNTTGLPAGQLSWQEIDGLSVLNVAGKTLLVIVLTDPEAFLERQPAGWKKKLMRINYKSYGSPVSLSHSGMRCSFKDMVTYVHKGYETYKQPQT